MRKRDTKVYSEELVDPAAKTMHKPRKWDPFERFSPFGISKYELRMIKLKEKLMDDQQRDHLTLEPFKTLMEGNWQNLRDLLIEQPELINRVDACKANVIHLAYLHFKYDIGRKLVEMFPTKAVNGYGEHLVPDLKYFRDPGRPEDESMYLGENLLHITIVRRNAEETRWLLEFYRDHRHSTPYALLALLTGNARGSFFKEDMMFGGYPLHFAVCSNDPDIFDIVLTFSEGIRMDQFYKEEIERRNIPGLLTIFQLDGNGNNVLHLSAKYNLQNMYTHIINSARQIIGHELRAALLEHCNSHQSSQQAEEKLNITHVFDSSGGGNLAGYPPRESVVMVPNPKPTIHSWLEKDVTHSWLEKIISVLLRERLLWVLNKDLQTPITLAAASIAEQKGRMAEVELQERVNMIEFLINQHKELRWSYGPVTNYLIRLEGIELPYDYRRFNNLSKEKLTNMKSVIELMCIADCEKGVALPLIKSIIETKWNRAGNKEFLKICTIHFVIALLVTVIALFPNDVPSIEFRGRGGRMAAVLYPLTILMFVVFVFFGLWRTKASHMYKLWCQSRGAGAFEICLRLLYMAAFIILVVLQVVSTFLDGLPFTNENSLHIGKIFCLCLCVCTCWLYLFYFFMGHRSSAPFLITLYRIASRDIPYFLQFYLILLVSFGCPLAVLTNDGLDKGASSLEHLLHIIWQLIHESVQYNENEYDGLSSLSVDPDLVWLYDIVHTGFYFCISITLLNLLIGMISNTYQMYTNRGEGLVLLERYNIMSSIFSVFTKEDHVRAKYAAQDSEPVVVSATSSAKGALSTEIIEMVPYYQFQYQEISSKWLQNSERGGSKSGLSKKVCLFLLDPQNDFHDMRACPIIGSNMKPGSLAVPGACEDSLRISEMILTQYEAIDEIIVTLDSHHPCHISHAVYWRSPSGEHPPLFTQISIEDVKDDRKWKWRPVDLRNLDWAIQYLTQLSLKNRRVHCIWPPHCIIGSRGHAIVEPLALALKYWEGKTNKSVTYVMKGFNVKVEFYSAFQAEVKDPEDAKTGFNYELLNRLKMNDLVLICGQAMSHTVNYTLQDLAHHWAGDKSRLVLLKDGCSSVTSFEGIAESFMSKILDLGVQLQTCKSVFHNVLGIKEGIYSNRMANTKNCLPILKNPMPSSEVELLYPHTLRLLQESVAPLPVPIKSASKYNAHNQSAANASHGPETHSSSSSVAGSATGDTPGQSRHGRAAGGPHSLPPVTIPKRKIYKDIAVNKLQTENKD